MSLIDQISPLMSLHSTLNSFLIDFVRVYIILNSEYHSWIGPYLKLLSVFTLVATLYSKLRLPIVRTMVALILMSISLNITGNSGNSRSKFFMLINGKLRFYRLSVKTFSVKLFPIGRFCSHRSTNLTLFICFLY